MRTEIIKAINTEDVITVTRDNDKELIFIEFNFFISVEKAPIFILPDWAKCQDETFTSDNQAKLIPGNEKTRNRVVKTGVIIKITEYKNITFYTPASGTYKGRITYESSPNEERGIILNGVRVNCITVGNYSDTQTMVSLVRNHEGGLIASNTLDSSYKKIFNLSTIPLSKRGYFIKNELYIHSLEEFLNLLKGAFVGSWINICIFGKKYKTLLTGEINYKDIKVSINNKIEVCRTVSFTLEEV